MQAALRQDRRCAGHSCRRPAVPASWERPGVFTLTSAGPTRATTAHPNAQSHEDATQHNRYRLCTRAQSGPGPGLPPACVTSLRRGGFTSSRSARRQGSLCCHESRTVPHDSVLARSPTRGALHHHGHHCVSDKLFETHNSTDKQQSSRLARAQPPGSLEPRRGARRGGGGRGKQAPRGARW